MFEIPTTKKILIKHAIKWGFISIAYNFVIFFSIYLISKLFSYKSIRFIDRFDIHKDMWIRLFDVTIFTPILESMFVAILLIKLTKYLKHEMIIYICISVLFGSYHLIAGSYSLVLIIIISFQVQIYYLCKRCYFANFSILAVEGAVMHIMHNILVYAFTYYKILR